MPELFWHQRRALELFDEHERCSGIFHLPTGGGKSNLAITLIAETLQADPTHRFIWATHHLQLLRQTIARFMSLGGLFPKDTRISWFDKDATDRIHAFENAHILLMTRNQLRYVLDEAANRQQSRQFLRRGLRGHGEYEPHPVMLVYDESHEMGAKGFQRSWRKFDSRLLDESDEIRKRWTVLGLSATPIPTSPRGQQLLKNSIFKLPESSFGRRPEWQMMIHESISVDELRQREILCPLDLSIQESGCFEIPAAVMESVVEEGAIELPEEPGKSELERFCRQFNSDIMSHNAVLRHLAEQIGAHLHETLGKTLVFCPTIRAAERLAQLLRRDPRVGVGRVSLVHSRLDEYEDDVELVDSEGEIGFTLGEGLFEEAFDAQEQVMAFLEKGDDPCVMINVGMLTTGFDDPRIKSIILARLTFSTNLYFQMLGRGLRGPAIGGTDSCVYIDPIRLLDRFKAARGYRPSIGRFREGDREVLEICPGKPMGTSEEKFTLDLVKTEVTHGEPILRRDLAQILIEFLELGEMPEPQEFAREIQGQSTASLYAECEELVQRAMQAAAIAHGNVIDMQWLLSSRHLPRPGQAESVALFVAKVQAVSNGGFQTESEWESAQVVALSSLL